jgi:hypothetical protein
VSGRLGKIEERSSKGPTSQLRRMRDVRPLDGMVYLRSA